MSFTVKSAEKRRRILALFTVSVGLNNTFGDADGILQNSVRIPKCPLSLICRVFGVRHFSATDPAHDAELRFRHGAKLVIGQLRMTERTGEPAAAGVALVRDNVDKRMPVTAPALPVDSSLNLCH